MNYLEEVNKWGKSLPVIEREVASSMMEELLDAGRTPEWLYFAIQNLGDREFLKNKNLFFYKPFQQEVDEKLYILNKDKKEIEEKAENLLTAYEHCQQKQVTYVIHSPHERAKKNSNIISRENMRNPKSLDELYAELNPQKTSKIVCFE